MISPVFAYIGRAKMHVTDIITHADDSRGSKALICVCVCLSVRGITQK